MEHSMFPKEVTGQVPLITLTGTEEICVEQHRGLVSYQPDRVVLKTVCGLLTISGDALLFSRYSADEAAITGHISTVGIDDSVGERL